MLRRPRTRMTAEAVYGPIPNPFVTVVVPMYNEADCIADCARSVLGQDFAPLELLVVDDGSADGSAAICESLGVTVLRQDHRGRARRATWAPATLAATFSCSPTPTWC